MFLIRSIRLPHPFLSCRRIFALLFASFLCLSVLCGVLTLGILVIPPPPLDILVLGIDEPLTSDSLPSYDSLFIVNINPHTFHVSLLSIPTHVQVAQGDDFSYVALRDLPQIDTGTLFLDEVIQQNFGIEIDGMIAINYDGFTQMIDAVGGVEVYVERVLEDNDFPLADGKVGKVRFESGTQNMDGERALQYARIIVDDDTNRSERQQQIISGFVKESINPTAWAGIMQTIGTTVETDIDWWALMTSSPSVLLSRGRFNRITLHDDFINADGQIDSGRLAPLIAPYFD